MSLDWAAYTSLLSACLSHAPKGRQDGGKKDEPRNQTGGAPGGYPHLMGEKRPADKADPVCAQFRKNGRCDYGASCKYAHVPREKGMCQRFLRGTCDHMDRPNECQYSHGTAETPVGPPREVKRVNRQTREVNRVQRQPNQPKTLVLIQAMADYVQARNRGEMPAPKWDIKFHAVSALPPATPTDEDLFPHSAEVDGGAKCCLIDSQLANTLLLARIAETSPEDPLPLEYANGTIEQPEIDIIVHVSGCTPEGAQLAPRVLVFAVVRDFPCGVLLGRDAMVAWSLAPRFAFPSASATDELNEASSRLCAAAREARLSYEAEVYRQYYSTPLLGPSPAPRQVAVADL